MDISQQDYSYKITFLNSQKENTNSEGAFVLKNRFKILAFKISGIPKLIWLTFGITNLVDNYLRL